MQTTIRAAGPADLIAYAWFRMGYRPSDSLTFVGVREGRWTGVVARLDLPPDKHRRTAIATLTDLIVEGGDDGFVVVITSGGPPAAFRPLVKAIRSQARADGLDLLDAFLVGDTMYWSLNCKDPVCCPPGGRPVEEILASRVAAAMVLEGRPLHDDVEGLVADVEPVGSAFGPVVALPDGDEPGVSSRQEASAVRERLISWWFRWLDLMLGNGPVAPVDVAWLIPALEVIPFRDAVLISLPSVVLPGDGADDRGSSLATRIAADVLAGVERQPDDRDPDEAVVRRAQQVLAAVARTAPPGRRAESLAVLAWVAWWEGDATRARLLVDRALADRPAHRLAGLVGNLVADTVPPGWVLRRRNEESFLHD